MFQYGLDVFLEDIEDYVQENERVGLVTNQTGVTVDLGSIIDHIHNTPHIQLTALFAGEHGIRGDVPAGIRFDNVMDKKTGIKVYSLYGKQRKINQEMFENVDTLIFDIQDVGVRFYTFLGTLIYQMEACLEHHKRMIVLDRPNPIANKVFGSMLDLKFKSFVGPTKMLAGTGLTIGEFASYIKETYYPKLDLTVVTMKGYNRNRWMDEIDVPWVAPSPNIHSKESTLYYPLTCVIEGTKLTEGRGTTRPFQMFGAPWLRVEETIKHLRSKNLKGLLYNPVYFTPNASKFKDEFCKGVQLFITDRNQLDYTRIPFEILHSLHEVNNEFEWLPPFKEGGPHFIDYLYGTNEVRLAIDQGKDYGHFEQQWKEDQRQWLDSIQSYYLYQ